MRTQSAKDPTTSTGPSGSAGFAFEEDDEDYNEAKNQSGKPTIHQQRSQSERAKRTKNYLRESMVESFVSMKDFEGSDGHTEEEEDENTELLMDYRYTHARIKGIAYCDELEILTLSFNDGSIQCLHFDIQLDKDGEADDEDDEYGRENEFQKENVIIKKSYEQCEGSNSLPSMLQNQTDKQKHFF